MFLWKDENKRKRGWDGPLINKRLQDKIIQKNARNGSFKRNRKKEITRSFLNGPTPASFPFIVGLFKQSIQFVQQINLKKCPSSIWRRNSNPWPFEHELSPITTRPGLPPYNIQKKIVPSPFPGFELLLCLMSHPCLGTEHRHKQLLFSLSRLSGRSYRLNRYCCGNIFTFRYLWFPYRFRGCRRNERREKIDHFIGDYRSIYTQK